MTKLLACSIIVILVFGGVIYVINQHISMLNNALEGLDAEHDKFKSIDHVEAEKIKPMIKDMRQNTQKVYQMVKEVRNILFKGIIVLGVTSILLGLIVTVLITVPVKKLITGARKIADGDLTTTIKVNNKDELGELADIFNRMSDKLRKLIERINQEVNQVNIASQELSAVSEEVATISDEQESNVKNNLILLKEFDDLVDKTAKDIKNSTKLSTQTRDLAVQGADNNNDLIKDMKKIDRTTQKLNSTIEELNNKSSKINSAVETIEDIAEQTNILALNAAIEAARNNKEGQGFTVVAEEIRKLAANVKSSTIEIKKMVQDLQLKSQEAVEDSNINYQLVKTAIESTLDTIEGFKKIKSNLNQISNQMLEVEDMTQEERNKLNKIVTNIEKTNQRVQTLSLSAQNTANSTEQLKSFTDNLDDSVKEFKL
jgi:methyl-accepting chemotaxis protein